MKFIKGATLVLALAVVYGLGIYQGFLLYPTLFKKVEKLLYGDRPMRRRTNYGVGYKSPLTRTDAS